MATANYLDVDLDRLVRVQFDDAEGQTHDVVALACCYTAVRGTIAIEIVYDPREVAPLSAYMCPTERLARLLLPPKSVKKIRPYAAEEGRVGLQPIGPSD